MTTDLSQPVVIVACGDAGGASAMAPVVEQLQREGLVEPRVFAYREARSVWAARDLGFEELPESTTQRDARDLLTSTGAAAIAVGTSVNAVELEKRFIGAALETKIPSLAVLDFWSNYVPRFGDTDGELTYVPDVIAVMDERAQMEMIEAGFEPERILITGQPAFDDLAFVRAGFSDARRRRIRDTLGAGANGGGFLVTFVSQPLSAFYGATAASPTFIGFTEDDVLSELIGALEDISRGGSRVSLAVLPHPREDPRTFDGLASDDVEIVVSPDVAWSDLAMASELVVGMNSALLVEACYLGCETVSLQPGLRGPDMLPTNRLGLSVAVYDASEIAPRVSRLLLDEPSRRVLRDRLVDFKPLGGATERIAGLIQRLCAGELRQADNGEGRAT